MNNKQIDKLPPKKVNTDQWVDLRKIPEVRPADEYTHLSQPYLNEVGRDNKYRYILVPRKAL